MAIYHFSVKNISRSDGRSAVACAAYRSGENLIDERYGKEQDYTKKTGVEFTKIYAPENTNTELLDRNQLWNTVEKVENRKNSQLAREFEIAFPHELNVEQRQSMLNELCQDIVKRHGVVVDAAIHAPHTQSGSDERNFHAHIMFTTRSIDEHGNLGKKTREFNDNGKQEVEFWRENFADITNKHLALAGYLSEVDHRSYADQDNGLQPTIHEGSKVTQLRRQGIDTEISLKNDAIKARNAEKQRLPEILKGLEQEISLAESKISKYQSEIRLEASKQPLRATETQKQVEQPKPQENRLERKLEPSNGDKKNSIAENKELAENYAEKVQQTAKVVLDSQLKALQEKAKPLLANFEKLRDNKPLFFGKDKWEQDKNKALNAYNAVKNTYDSLKVRGVTDEHYKHAREQIAQHEPIYHAEVQQAIKELKAVKQTQLDKLAKSLGANFHALQGVTYNGKVLQTDEKGILQQTRNGIVYHPAIEGIEQGKSYNLMATSEKTYKVQQDSEIRTGKKYSQSKER